MISPWCCFLSLHSGHQKSNEIWYVFWNLSPADERIYMFRKLGHSWWHQSGELPWRQVSGRTEAWGCGEKIDFPGENLCPCLQCEEDNVFTVCVCVCVCVYCWVRNWETGKETGKHTKRRRHTHSLERQRERHRGRRDSERCVLPQEICATDTAQWPMSIFWKNPSYCTFQWLLLSVVQQ